MSKPDLKGRGGGASSWLKGEGTLCWAKITGHPLWPGQLIREGFAPANVRKLKKPGTVLLVFFGDLSFGWYPESQLVPFLDKYETCSKGQEFKKNKAYRKAVEEAKEVYDKRQGSQPDTNHLPLDMLQPDTWRTEFGIVKVPEQPTPEQLQECPAQYALEWFQELGSDPSNTELMDATSANRAAAALCWDFICSPRTYLTAQEEEDIASRPIPAVRAAEAAALAATGRDDKADSGAGSGPAAATPGTKAKQKQQLLAALKGSSEATEEKTGKGKAGKAESVSPIEKGKGKAKGVKGAGKGSGKKRGRKQQEDEEEAGEEEESGEEGAEKAPAGKKRQREAAKQAVEVQGGASLQGVAEDDVGHEMEEGSKEEQLEVGGEQPEGGKSGVKKKGEKTPAAAKTGRKKKGKVVAKKGDEIEEKGEKEESTPASDAGEEGSEKKTKKKGEGRPSTAKKGDAAAADDDKKAGSKEEEQPVLKAQAVTVRTENGRVITRAPPQDPLSLLAWCDPVPDESYMEDQGHLRPEAAVLRIPSELETRYWGSCGARAAAEKVEDESDRNKLLYGGSVQVELEELLAWVRALAQDPTPDSGMPGSRQVKELMTSAYVVAGLRYKEAMQRHSSFHRFKEVGSLLRGSMELLGPDFITPRTQWQVQPPNTAPSSLLTTRMVYPDAQVCGSTAGAQAIRRRVHASLLAMHAKGKPKVVQPAEKTPAGAAGARSQKQKSFSYAEDSASEGDANERLFVASEEEEASEDVSELESEEGEGVGKKRRRSSSGLTSPKRGKGLSKPVFHKKKLMAYKAKATEDATAGEDDKGEEDHIREVEQVDVLRKEYMERLPPNEAAFQAAFQRWQAERGKDWGDMPQLADGYPWKPYDLLQLVAEQGGCEAVSQANSWAHVASAYQQRVDEQRAAAGSGALSHSHTTALRKQLEHQYKTSLLPFENHLSKDCPVTKQLIDKVDDKGNLVYKPLPATADEDSRLPTRASFKPVKRARTSTGYDLGDFDDLGGGAMATGSRKPGPGTAAAAVASQKPAAAKQQPAAARTGSLPRVGSAEVPTKLNKQGSGRLFDAARPSAVGGGYRGDGDPDMRRIMIRYPERTNMPTHQRAVFVLKKFVPSLKKEGVTINTTKCVITLDAENPTEAQRARQELQARPWNHFPEMRLERHHTIIISIVKADEKPPPRPAAPPALAAHPSMNGTRNGRPQGLHMQPPPPPPGIGGPGVGMPGPSAAPVQGLSGPEGPSAAVPTEPIGPALAGLAAPLDPRRAAAHVAEAVGPPAMPAPARGPMMQAVDAFSITPVRPPQNIMPVGMQQSLGLGGLQPAPVPFDPRRHTQPAVAPPGQSMWQNNAPPPPPPAPEFTFAQQPLQAPAPAVPQPAQDQLSVLTSLLSSITQQAPPVGGIPGQSLMQPLGAPTNTNQELGPDPATLQQLLELLNAAGATTL